MFIVKFYTIQLVVFSGFLNYTYAMVDRSDKSAPSQSVRQDRQFRPVLNSIIFLIAANLVAKGALGLGTYQAPAIPGNVQGSLFLTLNQPSKTPEQLGQQYLPVWFPTVNQLGPSSTQPPRPVTQTQIINIGEPYEEVEELQAKDGFYNHKFFYNRYNSIEDPLESASSEEVDKKLPPEEPTTEINTEETTTINTDIEILPENTTNLDESLQEVARQAVPTTPVSTTTTPTTTTIATTAKPVTPTEGAPMNNQTANAGNQTANGTNQANTTYVGYGPPNVGYGPPNVGYGPPNVGYGPPNAGYGPPNGYQPISFTYGPPGNGSQNGTNTNTTGPGYSYLPAGDYGPYTGNENVGITYGPPGPPIYQRPFYQKPFLSSPEDPYLNSYNHQYYNNFYNSPSSYSNMYKYTDFFKNFYSKFDYNNYPSFYSNYLGK